MGVERPGFHAVPQISQLCEPASWSSLPNMRNINLLPNSLMYFLENNENEKYGI